MALSPTDSKESEWHNSSHQCALLYHTCHSPTRYNRSVGVFVAQRQAVTAQAAATRSSWRK